MQKILENIERYKYAIIGTIVFHVIFFMSSNFVTLDRTYLGNSDVEEITEITIEPEEIELDAEMLEMLNLQNMQNNEPISNFMNDENDTRERSYENFSEQELEQQVLEEAKALEKEYTEYWASTHDNSNNMSSSDQKKEKIEPVDKKQPQTTDKLNPNGDKSAENAFAGQTMGSFNLKGRKATAFKIPGYTCNGAGTVVIDIKVDKNGDVKLATYNPALSQNANPCMIEKSERYARMAHFDYNATAPALASGTITYRFVAQ